MTTLTPAELYARAEDERRRWNQTAPARRLDPPTFARCLADARAALAATESDDDGG